MPQFNEKYDPTEGMSVLDKLLAGVGAGMYHTGLGVGQAFGMVSDDDIKAQRKLDEALMATGLGSVGNTIGRTVSLVPLAFVPGANTLAGAGLLGMASGAMAPSASDGEAVQNIVGGGLLGPFSRVAGRGVQGAMEGGLLFPRRLGQSF